MEAHLLGSDIVCLFSCMSKCVLINKWIHLPLNNTGVCLFWGGEWKTFKQKWRWIKKKKNHIFEKSFIVNIDCTLWWRHFQIKWIFSHFNILYTQKFLWGLCGFFKANYTNNLIYEQTGCLKKKKQLNGCASWWQTVQILLCL